MQRHQHHITGLDIPPAASTARSIMTPLSAGIDDGQRNVGSARLERIQHRLLIPADDDRGFDGNAPDQPTNCSKLLPLASPPAIHTTDLSAKLLSEALTACALVAWSRQRNEWLPHPP